MKKNNFNIIFFFILISFTLNVKADDNLSIGKDIFLNKAVCSSCHMLEDAGSNGMIGPNLDQIRPDKNRVMMTVKNGIGIMPAYEGELTLEEIEAVSIYVSTVAGN